MAISDLDHDIETIRGLLPASRIFSLKYELLIQCILEEKNPDAVSS